MHHLIIFLFLCLVFLAPSSHSQSPVINLGECSFNLINPANPDPNIPRDGTFVWEDPADAPDTEPGWYCRDNNTAEGPGNEQKYRVESTYRGRIYGCPENDPPVDGTQACMYHEICNFDPPNAPACLSMNHDGAGSLSSNTKNEDGDGLFTISDVRSPCYIVTGGDTIDLTTIEPNDVQFDVAVLGIEQQCRDLLSIYQNQLSRSGGAESHDTFSLSTSYSTP